ncbi:50S ribosomal protein L27 [Candidatus Saccharibacteria bacterium]|nr:50S ribosomal protein L27 [Candidatus Saccharibacteria bacterium]
MSKVKGQGSTKNNRKTAGKRLGVKRYAGQKVSCGEIIVRQVGLTKRAGDGAYFSRNFSIHAARDGVVRFQKKRYPSFSGRNISRTTVIVDPL